MAREYPERPVIAVGAFVFKDGQVLLVRRGKMPGRGKWSIPGGAVELGETLRDAVAREVREETGVDIEVGPLALILEPVVRDENEKIQFHYVIVDFSARWLAGEPHGETDVLEARWAKFAELDDLETTPGLAVAAKRAWETAGDWGHLSKN
jgi:8-oxo-dGTP diphosphatase